MHDYVMLVENRRVTVNMHQQLLGCQDTSDLRHLGTGAEVSVRHFGTSAEVPGHFGTSAEMYEDSCLYIITMRT